MNLHRIGVIVTAAGNLARNVGTALETVERSRRRSLSIEIPTLLAVGAGIAIGALATKAELRRRARDYLFGVERKGPEAPANGASATHVPSGRAASSSTTAHC